MNQGNLGLDVTKVHRAVEGARRVSTESGVLSSCVVLPTSDGSSVRRSGQRGHQANTGVELLMH